MNLVNELGAHQCQASYSVVAQQSTDQPPACILLIAMMQCIGLS